MPFGPLDSLRGLNELQRQPVFLDRCQQAVIAASTRRADVTDALQQWTTELATPRERAIAHAAIAAISLLHDTSSRDWRAQTITAQRAWLESFGAPPPGPGIPGPKGEVVPITRWVLSDLAEDHEAWRRGAAVGRLIAFLAGQEAKPDFGLAVRVALAGADRGHLGRFELWKRPGGVGAHYFDPVDMAFFVPDMRFRIAVDLAWRLTQLRFPVGPAFDVVWRLGVAGEDLDRVAGESIGLAAAVGFEQVLSRRPRRWPRTACFTGAIDPRLDGTIRSVGGYAGKVEVLKRFHLIYPADDYKAVRQALDQPSFGDRWKWRRRTHSVERI